MIEYVSSVVTNIVVQIVSKIPESIISLLTLKVVTSYLTVEEFGIYSFAVAYTSLFLPICDAGMTPILTREVSKNRDKASILIGNATIVRFALITVYSLVIFLSTFFIRESTKRYITIFLLLSVLTYPMSTVNSIFYSELKVWWLSIANILKKLLFLLLFFLCSLVGLRLSSAAVSYVISENFIVLFLFFIALRYVRPLYKFDIKLAKFILLESLPIFMTILVSMFYTRIDTIMLAFLTNNYTVGTYNGALQFYNFVFFVSAVINSVFYPLLSKFVGKKEYTSVLFKGVIISLLAGVVVLLVSLAAAEVIIVKFLSEKYFDSVKIFKILSFGVPFAFINIILGNAFISVGKQQITFVLSLITSVINILLNLFFIPKYFALGAALATVLTQLCGFVVYSLMIRKTLKASVV